MAYAYSAVDDMINGGGQQNQNVFGAGGDQGQPGQQTQVGGQDVKTSTEGDLGSAPSGGLGTNQPAKTPTVSTDQQNRNAQTSAFKANTGKTQAPAALAGVQKNIDDANSGLAQRAADYTNQQKAKQNYGVDTSIIDQAIGGNADSRSKTSQLLGRSDINQVDNFDAGDVSVKDADLLKSDAGLKELASRGQGPQYTQGMGAFDAMLLRRDPAFNSQVQNIQGQVSNLNQSAANNPALLQKSATDYGKENLATSQKAAKDYLGQSKSAIDTENASEAKAANDKLASLDKGKITQDAVTAARQKAQELINAQYGQRANEQLAGATVDPSQYVNFAQNYDPSQFYSKTDADKYNTINSLLGLGGPATMESGALGDPYSVKQDELANALYGSASKARQDKDVAGKSQIDKILAAAQQRADTDDTRRGGEASNYGSDLTKLAQGITSSGAFDQYRGKINDQSLLDLSQGYAKQKPLQNYDLGSSDVLNADEASQLNALSKDIGAQDTYGAGQYAGGVPKNNVDSAGFRDYLLQALKGYQSEPGFGAAGGGAYAGGQLANTGSLQGFAPSDGALLAAQGPSLAGRAGLAAPDAESFNTNPFSVFQNATPGQNFNIQSKSGGNDPQEVARQTLMSQLFPTLAGGY